MQLKVVSSRNDGHPGETGDDPPGGEGRWEEQPRTYSAVSVEQVFPAVSPTPSHAACLKDKIPFCPLRSFEVKDTTEYHENKIKAMGKAPCCLQSTRVFLPAWRGLCRLV